MKAVISGTHFIEKSYLCPLFLTEITVKIKNQGYIRDEQVKIYKNLWFVFDFTSLEFLTFFQGLFWPEIDDVGNSNSIENLENLKTSKTFNFEKFGWKVWPWVSILLKNEIFDRYFKWK